ncbi:MAG: hypothetical protein L6Q29_00845 [Candidatus Pacebacteria bacterium]|nr:hypothetical protein [Candidatus Paceibacterota bacterium]NUQ57164.1 hypothetical protein [Candidatus Paceibacter sp.]
MKILPARNASKLACVAGGVGGGQPSLRACLPAGRAGAKGFSKILFSELLFNY